jgi:hypothetical protein
MANYSVIAEEIFRILHSRSFRITMYDQEGNHVYEPSGARKFYIPEPGIMVSINEDPETSSLRFYINQDVEYYQISLVYYLISSAVTIKSHQKIFLLVQ